MVIYISVQYTRIQLSGIHCLASDCQNNIVGSMRAGKINKTKKVLTFLLLVKSAVSWHGNSRLSTPAPPSGAVCVVVVVVVVVVMGLGLGSIGLGHGAQSYQANPVRKLHEKVKAQAKRT